jgi:hypothetical protein
MLVALPEEDFRFATLEEHTSTERVRHPVHPFVRSLNAKTKTEKGGDRSLLISPFIEIGNQSASGASIVVAAQLAVSLLCRSRDAQANRQFDVAVDSGAALCSGDLACDVVGCAGVLQT